MKKFVKPEIKIIKLNSDIICTSGYITDENGWLSPEDPKYNSEHPGWNNPTNPHFPYKSEIF